MINDQKIPSVREGRQTSVRAANEKRDRLAEVEEELEGFTAEEADIIESARLQLQSLRDDVRARLHEKSQLIRERVDMPPRLVRFPQAEDDCTEVRDQLNHVTRQRDEAQRKVTELEQQIARSAENLHRAEGDRDRVNSELERARENLNRAREEHAQLVAVPQAPSPDPAEANRHRQALEEANRRIEQLEGEVRNLTNQRNDAAGRADSLQSDLEEANRHAEEFKTWLDEANARANQLQSELEEANRRAEEFRTWLDEANARANQLQSELDQLRNGTQQFPATPSPPAPPAPAPTQRRRFFDVRHWTWAQWGFAIIGLLIMLVVSSVTVHPLVTTAHITGVGRGFFKAFWYIGLCGLGFFGGGNLGLGLGDRLRSAAATRQQQQP